ncbi:glycosyltransferase family 2 protein [Paenibacillus sp. MWE-103]|uniref:Glycosyltransferase family 2 protein n=1 Tax=Paenibacillus artemisiicola TaxID=1172618 RepID=A0ABS3WGH5_9BACL|nr:glycosyltransferase family 2 protein [Paenibacillus artemisiicola]MBO7747235.1 glycosyltransferase family 2 protein [Paenibacillus artemisiicola]
MPIRLALVMIVRNEEAKLARCLESASPYMDDIIIVDTGSTDRTKEIAERFGARVFDFAWQDDFAAARNYALDQSVSEWNLVLDADEYIVRFDRQAMDGLLQETKHLGRIEVVSLTSEQEGEGHAKGYITRLLPSQVRFEGRIHEQAVSGLPRVNVPIAVLHDGYLHTDKSARNIPILLAEAAMKPNDAYVNYQLGKEYQGVNDLERACHYFERAFRRLHGRERYAPNAAVQYIYALKDAKRYEAVLSMINLRLSWVQSFPDYHFACGVFYLELVLSDPGRYIAYLPEIEASYLRSIALGETDRYDTVEGTGSYLALYNLAVYYEIFGRTGEALDCLKRAGELGYEKAKARLSALKG